jgi:hypothetical protein
LKQLLASYISAEGSKLVSHALAFAQLIPANSVEGIQSSLNLSLAGDQRLFEGDIEYSGRSRDGGVRVSNAGIYFGEILVASPPSISLRQEKTFVRTGWTHQRKDGGPDLRYSNNPPIGYFRVTGHILTVNGREFRYANDPSGLVRIINEWSDFYFSKVVSLSDKVLKVPRTDIAKKLYPEAEVKCETCGTVQHFVKGQVAQSCMTVVR